MSLKINNETITTSDLTGGNSNTKYFGTELTQLIPNKTGYKLLGSPSQREQLKRMANSNISYALNYTPKITDIVNPGDNTNLYEEITEIHKIVSNVTNGSYISINTFSPAQHFEIQIAFTPTGTSSAGSDLFHSMLDATTANRYGLAIGLENNMLWANASTDRSWTISLTSSSNFIELNKKYWLKFGWTGKLYYLDVLKEGEETYTRIASVYSSNPPISNLTKTIIGNYYYSSYENPFLGTIDLTETYIRLNGEYFFNGATAVQDTDYNITGNISITEEQVSLPVPSPFTFSFDLDNVVEQKVIDVNRKISNFSADNYYTLSNDFNPGGNPWSIEFGFQVNENAAQNRNNYIISRGTGSSAKGLQIYYSTTASKLHIYCPYRVNGNYYTISWSIALSKGSYHLCKLSYANNYYKVEEYDFTTKQWNLIKDQTDQPMASWSSSTVLGCYTTAASQSNTAYELDYISLSSLKFTINDEVIFDGSTAILGQDFTQTGGPTLTEEVITEPIYKTLSQGTKYLLEHPNLIKVKTENNNLYFNFPWLDGKWKYLPNNILTTGANSISLISNTSDIKLTVNNHNFTLTDSDLPLITTGVLGYREELEF